MRIAGELHDQFEECGYVGPIHVLSSRECRRFLLAVGNAQPPLDWGKGHAASARAFYEISTYPAIIEVVSTLLGGDVMLWGATIRTRRADAVHAWHCDIESSNGSGKTVSVWIGLEHTNQGSSLLFIPYSHRFGVTVQEATRHCHKRRGEPSDEDIVGWAREREKQCDLVRPVMTNGDALFFDGRLWHGSHNLSGKTRRALLLQYATPDTMIRMPDPNHLHWPFHQLTFPKPPCVMIRGTAKSGVNRMVSPPVERTASNAQLSSRVYPLRIPLPPDEEKGWKSYPIFKGATVDVQSLSCHASVLTQDQCPHPPHVHDGEEILLLLSGEVNLILPNRRTLEGDERNRLKPGQFVYYPTGFAHTLRTVSEEPANYLMFKWTSEPAKTQSPLGFGCFNLFAPEDSEVQKAFFSRRLLEGPTAYLRKFHCHVSTLQPGAGYDPHIDAYEVAIIVLEGEVETLGERVGPHGVIFYPAGEPHGLRNPGKVTARYVVFEFHGGQTGRAAAFPNPLCSLLIKLTDPQRWKRLRKRLFAKISKRLNRS